MARLMLSFGMFSALAAAMALRRRGLPSGSPPDLAAMVISLISWVNILPRLASSAPFLCLIVAHFEWPDMRTSTSLLFGNMGQKAGVRGTSGECPQRLSITPWKCSDEAGSDKTASDKTASDEAASDETVSDEAVSGAAGSDRTFSDQTF